MSCKQLGSLSFAFASLLVFATCTPLDPSGPGGGSATLAVRADLSGTAVDVVVLEVTAADIPTPLVFNLVTVGGVASGTITLPAGSGRMITMRAFDAGAVETHRGSVTVNIQAGTNPTIAVVLAPLIGDIPIVATIGSLTITVTPPSPTVEVGITVILAAEVAVNGTPVPATVTWATANPGVASVNSFGGATGVAPGQTTIVATFQGVAGSATVTVTGP